MSLSGFRDSLDHPPNVFGMPPGPLPGPAPAPSGVSHHSAPVSTSPAPLPDWGAIIDQLPYGLIVLGAGQELRHENATCRQLLGFGVAEKGGVEGWLAAVCPDQSHREKVINSWREHIWRNQLTRTFTLKTAAQKLKEIEFRSSLLRDGGITLTIEDVTEARRTEETLRHGKLKFRALFSHSETGTVLVDRTGRIIDANPAFLSLVGMPLKELRLSTLFGLLHPGDAEELVAAEEALTHDLRDHPGGDRVITRELRLRTRSSEKRTRLTYCPIGEPTGRPSMGIYLFASAESESLHEKLAARLKTLSAKAQALLNAVPDLILLINPDGKVADYAPPSRPWAELTPDDSWRHKQLEEVWPVFGNLFRQYSDRISRENKTIHAGIRGVGIDGFEFAVTLSPCGDGQVLAVVRNHSETRALLERESWKNAAFSESPLPIVKIDPSGMVSTANRAASDLLGLSEEDLSGRKFSDFCEDGKRPLHEVLSPSSEDSEGKVFQVNLVSAKGDRLKVTSEFFALEQEGKPSGSLVFLQRCPDSPDAGRPYAGRPDAGPPDPVPSRAPSAFPSLSNEKRQHGFRNQLQLVTSLFSLEPQGAAARDAFLRWQVRLRSMALACPYDNASAIGIFPLLRSLADEVCSLTGRGPGRREIILTGREDLTIDSQSATPFSLLIGELMRLVLAARQPGRGPELYLNLGVHGSDGFQLTVRPGTDRKFVFGNREAEVETLELLTEQIQGRLQAADPENPAREWILIVPSRTR